MPAPSHMTLVPQTRLRITEGLRRLGTIRDMDPVSGAGWLALAYLPGDCTVEGLMWPGEWAYETAARCAEAVEETNRLTAAEILERLGR